MNLAEINREIYALETGPTTCSACEKLASLYVVRDHLDLQPMQEKSEPPQHTIQTTKRSEFLDAVKDKNQEDVWNIIDEHMAAVQALYPKEYSAVLSRIRALGDMNERERILY